PLRPAPLSLHDALPICQDGARVERFPAVGRLPHVPEPGQGKELPRAEPDTEGRLAPAFGAPCVKAVRGQETAPLAEGTPERGLLGRGFAARVDEPVADGGLLGPERDESPAQPGEGGAAVPVQGGQDGLSWRHVVAGPVLFDDLRRNPLQTVVVLHEGQGLGEGVAAAHGGTPPWSPIPPGGPRILLLSDRGLRRGWAIRPGARVMGRRPKGAGRGGEGRRKPPTVSGCPSGPGAARDLPAPQRRYRG